jgi:hypothetical protein
MNDRPLHLLVELAYSASCNGDELDLNVAKDAETSRIELMLTLV